MAQKDLQMDDSQKQKSLDRQWIKKSLESQRAMLVRSRSKELAGSEIYALRGAEIATLDRLINEYS